MSLSNKEQILKLDSEVKADLGVSKIHGIGVIALRNISKGERIYADSLPSVYTISYSSLGKLFPVVRKIILDRWPSIVNGSKFIYPDARLLSFMNHGENDNYDPMTDTAKCDIIKGEEILENYKLMANWEKVWLPQKNLWLNATNVKKNRSLRNFSVARLVRKITKSFARS